MVLHAQDELLSVDMELKYFQKNNDFELMAILVDEDGEPIEGLEVLFTAHISAANVKLGTATSNQKGVASIIKPLNELRKLGHQFHFESVFTGNSTYDAVSSERDIRDVNLFFTTEIIDSVYTVGIQLNGWTAENEIEPIPDTDVVLYVPRLFSLLPIGEAYTNKQGGDQFEFPMDLPGGPNGELAIISRIEEHEDFGTIEFSHQTTWGMPLSGQESNLQRTLWTPDAPLWMVITFSILMVGAWGHYLLIVIKLFQIRRQGNTKGELIYTE